MAIQSRSQLYNSHRSIITLTSMLSPCVRGRRSWRSKAGDLCYLANRACWAARTRARVSERERARWHARWKERRHPIIIKRSMLEPLASIIKSNWTFTKSHPKLKLAANAGKWLKSLFPALPTTNAAFPVGRPTAWTFTPTLNVACVLKAKLNFDLQMVLQQKKKKERKYIL